jgi:solute carrier family 27 fatty acid transporter 1/4
MKTSYFEFLILKTSLEDLECVFLEIFSCKIFHISRALARFIKLLIFVRRLQNKNVSLGQLFTANVAKNPDKACMIFEGREWSFKEVNDLSNRIANVFHQHGYKHGDKVGLLMENRPEFVAIWLGLSKLGVVVPLINHNLKKQSLLHSITISDCSAIIFGESLTDCKLFFKLSQNFNGYI